MVGKGIGERYRAWLETNPLRDGWTELKKLRAAFNAGWHFGHQEARREGAVSNARKAYNRGLNEQLEARRLTHRGASKVLSELYRHITFLDKKGKRDGSERANIAEATNRIKLNYHLLKFLQEKGLVLEFKKWYFAAHLGDEPEEKQNIPSFQT